MRLPLIDNLLRRLGRPRGADGTDFAQWEEKHRKTVREDLAAVWEHLPDELRFLDVGANVGLFSEMLMQGRPASRGWLFEPVAEMHARCSKRFEGDSRVTIENFALADEPGEATIYKARYNPGGNSLVHELMYDTRDVSAVAKRPDHQEEQIRLEVFDDYAARIGLEHVDFIKTDCEGFDHRVLKGMLGFIEACDPKPVILSEFLSEWMHPFWKDQIAIIEELYGLGYQELDLSHMERVQNYLLLPEGR